MVSHVGRRCIRLTDESFTRSSDGRFVAHSNRLSNDRARPFGRRGPVDIPDEGFGGNGVGFSAMSEFNESRPGRM